MSQRQIISGEDIPCLRIYNQKNMPGYVLTLRTLLDIIASQMTDWVANFCEEWIHVNLSSRDRNIQTQSKCRKQVLKFAFYFQTSTTQYLCLKLMVAMMTSAIRQCGKSLIFSRFLSPLPSVISSPISFPAIQSVTSLSSALRQLWSNHECCWVQGLLPSPVAPV